MLKDKVAIVTGAGRGIGEEIALALAKQGASVLVADLDIENAERVAIAVRAIGVGGAACKVDISNELQVKNMIDTCIASFGKVDILVNNAGIVSTKPLTGISVAEWDSVMAINLRGVFLCCREVFSLMAAQKNGKIINIASVAGKRGGGLLGTSAYAASKGGVIALTKSIAREGGPHGINANAICPAYTATEMTSSLTPDQVASILKLMPLGRPGKPAYIASAVCFLASDQAEFITGEIMDVDGGLMMD